MTLFDYMKKDIDYVSVVLYRMSNYSTYGLDLEVPPLVNSTYCVATACRQTGKITYKGEDYGDFLRVEVKKGKCYSDNGPVAVLTTDSYALEIPSNIYQVRVAQSVVDPKKTDRNRHMVVISQEDMDAIGLSSDRIGSYLVESSARYYPRTDVAMVLDVKPKTVRLEGEPLPANKVEYTAIKGLCSYMTWRDNYRCLNTPPMVGEWSLIVCNRLGGDEEFTAQDGRRYISPGYTGRDSIKVTCMPIVPEEADIAILLHPSYATVVSGIRGNSEVNMPAKEVAIANTAYEKLCTEGHVDRTTGKMVNTFVSFTDVLVNGVKPPVNKVRQPREPKKTATEKKEALAREILQGAPDTYSERKDVVEAALEYALSLKKLV